MPRGNGLGPNGAGPMSGRGLGFCAGYDAPGYMQQGFGGGYGSRGRGFRQGFGRGGRGYGLGFRRGGMVPQGYGFPPYGPEYYPEGPYASYTKEDEAADLREQADFYKTRLQQLEKRLNDLEKSGSEE